MPRDIGRNTRKVFLKPWQTIQMCEEAERFIDNEIATSATGELDHLKDKVYDHLFMVLPWWDASWVTFPGFCDWGGKRKDAWTCIRLWWGKQHPGFSLRSTMDDKLHRPGTRDGVWYVIQSWDQALPIVQLTLEDNAGRIDNDMEAFHSLLLPRRNRAILTAVRSAGTFAAMQFQLIEAATWFSDVFDAGPTPADVHTTLGWVHEDSAIDAVERRCGFSNTATRQVGRELWAEYSVLVSVP